MRRAALALLAGLVLAAPAWADEAATPKLATPRLAAEDLLLLPLDELEWSELGQAHPALVRQTRALARRVRTLDDLRAKRADPGDDGGRRIADQAEELRGRLAPLIERVLAAIEHEGVDDALLASIRATPRGPLRSIRHATALVPALPDLPPDVRALLAHVQPRLEGALLALHARKDALRTRGARAGLEPKQVEALAAGIDTRMRAIERRWWRLVDYITPAAARVTLRTRLPGSHQKHETGLQYLYTLPDLSASQAVRLRAILEEVQAEAAPDQAIVKRGGNGLDGDTPTADARAAVASATGRLVALQRWARTEARGLLTAAQIAAIEAIPPRVRIEDRKATSVAVLQGVDLTAAQRVRLKAMRAELVGAREAYRLARAKASAGMSEMGPDSPQMAGKHMAMANVESEANVVQRRFNGRILRELLRPDQVLAWVLDPPADAR